MPVSLKKGEKVSLTKSAGSAGLTKIMIGLGWDARVTDGKPFDADASAFLLADTGKVKSDEGLIFFNNKKSACGAVEHMGDNTTGAGDGDDEVISVDLNKVPANVQHIVFTVNSFLGQKFDVVENAFVRIVNGAGGAELCRFQLSAKVPNTAMIMSRLYRHNGEWKFAAIGDPADGRTVQDLAGAIARLF